MDISISLASKLASVVVHADEMMSDSGLTALKQAISDPEVKAWIKELGPLAPAKRLMRERSSR